MSGAMAATFVFRNKCNETIYPGVQTNPGRPAFPTTGFQLQPDAAVLGLGAGLKLEAGGREGRPAGVRLHAGVDRLLAIVSEHERSCHCA